MIWGSYSKDLMEKINRNMQNKLKGHYKWHDITRDKVVLFPIPQYPLDGNNYYQSLGWPQTLCLIL